MLYAPSFFFLMVIFSQFPTNTNLLKQSEWIRTLIIEDEFTDPTNSAQKDFAKNALQVEGMDDIWNWGEAMLLGSLYDEDDSPICSAGAPLTIDNPSLVNPQVFPADLVDKVIDPDIISGCAVDRQYIPPEDRVDGQPDYGLELLCDGFRVVDETRGPGSLMRVTSSIIRRVTTLVPFELPAGLQREQAGWGGRADFGIAAGGTAENPVDVAVGLVLDTCEISFDDAQAGQVSVPCGDLFTCKLTKGLQQPQLLFEHNLLLGNVLVQQVRSFTHRGAGRSENGCVEGVLLGDNMDAHACYQDLSTLPVGDELEESLRPFGSHALCPASINSSSTELSAVAQCQPGTTDCTFACAYQPGDFESPLQGSTRLVEGLTGAPPIFTQGFSVSLPRNKDAAKAVYSHLREDFVDRQTRMVAFSINLYNINLQHFTSMVVTFETDVSGQIEPYFRIQTVVPMENILYADGWWTTFATWVWLAMQVWLVWVEIKELNEMGFSSYFEDIWNKFEIIHVVIEFFFVVEVLDYHRLSRELVTDGLGRKLQRSTIDILGTNTSESSPYYLYETSRYAGTLAVEMSAEMHTTFDIQPLSTAFQTVESMLGLTCMFSALKFFKYMRLSRGLNLLWRVLDLAFWNMVVFAFVLIIICVGFGLFATLLFGYHVREFHNLISSMYALLNMAMGELEYAEYADLKRASGQWAPTFIVVFLLVLILVVLNMFIAILMDYYAQARDEDVNYRKQETDIFEAPKRKDAFTKIHQVRYDFASMVEELWHFVFPTWTIDEQPIEHIFCFKSTDGTIQGPFFYRCAGPLVREGQITEQTPIWFMQARVIKSYTAETASNLSLKSGQLVVVTRQRVSHAARRLGQTLPTGQWQGYLDGEPQHVGTFPSDAVEMIWIAYSECKLQLQLNHDELDGTCPKVQADGSVRLTFDLRKTPYRDFRSASTTIHAGTCFHQEHVGKIASVLHNQEAKVEQLVHGAVKKGEEAVEAAVHTAEDAATDAAHKAGEQLGHAVHYAEGAVEDAARRAREQLGLLARNSEPEADHEHETDAETGFGSQHEDAATTEIQRSTWQVSTGKLTTRLRVHPAKPSTSTQLLLGGGPRTLLRHLRPGEKLLLTEPYTLRKLDVMLEFIRGDSVTYPKVMDTKKYMTFHSMEEQIATFRVSQLRSWTLWKSEDDEQSAGSSSKALDAADTPIVQLTMFEQLSIPPLLNFKLWARAIREHALERNSTVLSFLRETYHEYKIKVGLVQKDAADEHGELIDEYLDAIIQAIVQGVDNEYDIVELSTALKSSDVPIKDLLHRVQFHLARTGRENRAAGLDEEEVMHYINSHYNEAIVTDDEDSDDDDHCNKADDDKAERESEDSATAAGPTVGSVENLRAVLQQAQSSLNEYEEARKVANASIGDDAGQAQDPGSVNARPKPRLLSLLAQTQVRKSLKALEEVDESGQSVAAKGDDDVWQPESAPEPELEPLERSPAQP